MNESNATEPVATTLAGVVFGKAAARGQVAYDSGITGAVLGILGPFILHLYSRRVGAGARPTERSLLQSPTARSNTDSQINARDA